MSRAGTAAEEANAVPAPAMPLLGVVGPTASGKTDLALALARRLPVEIVVADSRQVYRGMDVGTASPTDEERAAVPHHLLDAVAPDEPFTVADWVRRARAAVRDIGGRGRVPLLVGGTGLYVAALLDGHEYPATGRSPDVRARLTAELDADGLEALADRLRRLDPETAERIDLRNPRRVVRALERIEVGSPGIPLAHPYPGRISLVALDRPREVLYRRIDRRAELLFETDVFLDEVRRLRDGGYGADLVPMTGHGYREALDYLAGALDLDGAIRLTARRTRQYAKRQLTWFRHDPRVRWIAAGERDGDDPALVAAAEATLGVALS